MRRTSLTDVLLHCHNICLVVLHQVRQPTSGVCSNKPFTMLRPHLLLLSENSPSPYSLGKTMCTAVQPPIQLRSATSSRLQVDEMTSGKEKRGAKITATTENLRGL